MYHPTRSSIVFANDPLFHHTFVLYYHGMAPTPIPAVDRVLRTVKKTKRGCWIPDRFIMRNGYTQVAVQGKMLMSHRVVYEALVGPIPDGMVLDHLCRNRACVNPKHCEPVSMRENNRRGLTPAGENARKTHCQNGHEFTPENTAVYSGHRMCRICNREYQRRKYALAKDQRNG